MNKTPVKFYDIVSKKKFVSSDYKIVNKATKTGKRSFAVTKGPKGNEVWRVMGKAK